MDIYCQPAFFGELALMFWLLIKGARPSAQDATASSSAVSPRHERYARLGGERKREERKKNVIFAYIPPSHAR